MYESHFGLTGAPFQLTPDSRFFFSSAAHSRALAHLTFGLNQAEGFIVVTGEVGAGKTMLVEYLCSRLDPEQFTLAKITTTQLSPEDLVRLVAAEFGVTDTGLAKADMLRRLHERIALLSASGKRPLLVVDEAQNLSVAALEELRMLSNVRAAGTPPLQSFLLGQPQFRQALHSPALEQLRQRVLAAYHLGPLERDETRLYVEHRLRKVDWSGRPSFEPRFFDALHGRAGGLPRMINTLASRVLLSAYLEETSHITADDVEAVADELAQEVGEFVGMPSAAPPMAIASGGDGYDALDQRVGRIETALLRHERTVRNMVEVVARYAERAS